MMLFVQKTVFLLLLLTSLFFQQCKKKEQTERNIVQEIQQTGVLVTAEYTLHKMVRANDNKTWFKLGDRKILISVEAIVKAGIDLQQIQKDQVEVKDSVIRLQLPPAKIFSVSIPPEKVKVKFQDVSLFRKDFSAAEREGLLVQAETQVRKLADSLGILQTAQKNADAFFQRLLQQKGFKEVNVEFRK